MRDRPGQTKTAILSHSHPQSSQDGIVDSLRHHIIERLNELT